jgi:primosomal replication protein N
MAMAINPICKLKIHGFLSRHKAKKHAIDMVVYEKIYIVYGDFTR